MNPPEYIELQQPAISMCSSFNCWHVLFSTSPAYGFGHLPSPVCVSGIAGRLRRPEQKKALTESERLHPSPLQSFFHPEITVLTPVQPSTAP